MPEPHDLSPDLVEQLTELADRYGARGVALALAGLYPGAMPESGAPVTPANPNGYWPVEASLGRIADRLDQLGPLLDLVPRVLPYIVDELDAEDLDRTARANAEAEAADPGSTA